MKYRCEVVVNVPRDKFIALFDNPANLPKWSPGLQTFEPISARRASPAEIADRLPDGQENDRNDRNGHRTQSPRRVLGNL